MTPNKGSGISRPQHHTQMKKAATMIPSSLSVASSAAGSTRTRRRGLRRETSGPVGNARRTGWRWVAFIENGG